MIDGPGIARDFWGQPAVVQYVGGCEAVRGGACPRLADWQMFSVGARWRTSSKWWAAIAVAADGIGMLRVMLALDTCRPRNGRQYETRLGSRGALASGGRDE